MAFVKSSQMNGKVNRKVHGQYEQYQQCELCHTAITHNPSRDIRSLGVFKGKGKILCNQCAVMLAKLPAGEALQALSDAAAGTEKK